MYNKTTAAFKSSNGVNDIAYYVYRPQNPKAMIQLVHGMCEYLERYEPFIDFLTDNGFLVYGCDHLGHKGSVSSDEDLGYMAHENGWKCLIKDQRTLNRMMKEENPGLKCFLYGHSMGSFVSRAYAARFPEDFDGVIFTGTSGANPSTGIAEVLIKLNIKFKGERNHSGLITTLMFAGYNKRYKNPTTAYDWLSRDEKVVREYIEDPYCGFMFTSSAYLDLINLIKDVTSDSWYNRIAVDLPVLFLGGTMDPVGNWGEGLKEIDAKMKRRERTDYDMILFEDMRHELHNEIGKEMVYDKVVNWINERL